MKTPIIDFVKQYAESDTARFHMPGHKGKGELSVERLDITEVLGADDLRSPEGIILESENNATEIFGTEHTYYLTEGSTLGIKAMLALAVGAGGRVLAARNAHKAFISAAALLDLSVSWMYPNDRSHLCECRITADDVRGALRACVELPNAVYVTSPDYLGNMLDISEIAKACAEFQLPLLVDNAHGAYLKFLKNSMHPIALGATMCCDSAHKTLPALTGTAYFHISKKAKEYTERARSVISLFASTSPSYLLLQSLDACNLCLEQDYAKKLSDTVEALESIKSRLKGKGIAVEMTEPLKLVVKPSSFGYTAKQLAQMLRQAKIEPEFVDCDYIVMMVSPSNTRAELDLLSEFFDSVTPLPPISEGELSQLPNHTQAMSIRNATFAPSKTVKVRDAVGKICSVPTVSCPPAIAVVVSGEVIVEEDIRIFEKYGIEDVEVVSL